MLLHGILELMDVGYDIPCVCCLTNTVVPTVLQKAVAAVKSKKDVWGFAIPVSACHHGMMVNPHHSFVLFIAEPLP